MGELSHQFRGAGQAVQRKVRVEKVHRLYDDQEDGAQGVCGKCQRHRLRSGSGGGMPERGGSVFYGADLPQFHAEILRRLFRRQKDFGRGSRGTGGAHRGIPAEIGEMAER